MPSKQVIDAAGREGAGSHTYGLVEALPPPFLLLLSILSAQLGAASAKFLLVSSSPATIVLVRTGFAAIVLWLMVRPQVRQYTKQQWIHALLLGVVTAAMNVSFYGAIARLPLGIVITVAFLGPFTVSLLASRGAREFVWPILALAGVVLLSPFGAQKQLSVTGMTYALGAAAGWASYLLLTARTSAMFSGTTGLALAMTFGALGMLPFGLASGGKALLSASFLAKGFAVSILSTLIPFSLEFLVLKRMSPRTFGILVSAEPAVAALIGMIVLHEYLGVREWMALVLVSVAALGVTYQSSGPRR
ncbi:MAG TPA: EamA family transporter [Candidatus Angelobacter sp.]|nr:EamA family transporter [Candidatus Angelobacter sp.]